MNQVTRTFVLVGLTVVILLAMHFLPTLYIKGVELRRVNVLSDILPEVYRERDAIDVIPSVPMPKMAAIADSSASVPNGHDIAKTGEQGFMSGDSLPSRYTVRTSSAILDFSEGKAGGMGHFYHALSNIASLGRPLRIAYYGDSFIEGDVMTCDLREMLQARYGGNGVGWVDCVDKLNGFRRTVKVKSHGLSAHEVVEKPFLHSLEGISQRYFGVSEGATLSVTTTGYKSHAASWQTATLYMRAQGGMSVVHNADSVYVSPSQFVQTIVTPSRGKRTVDYRFTSVSGVNHLFGVSMEPGSGVILDNFSMRGSAGFTLANIPDQTLADFARLRPYDLIIIHFGLNVASDKAHASNYKAYIRRMQQAIEHLRKAYPDASVLVVSIPDRDQRTDAGIMTMKGVESLVAYQQILAANSHVSFFNLFKAMGGRESMKVLVDKGWANKDYAHLSFRGGRYMAEIIFKALTED